MTMMKAWGMRTGLASGLLGMALAGCDLDVIDYPDGSGGTVGTGGASEGSGGAGPSSTGGSGSETGGAATAVGGTGGLANLGGMGGIDGTGGAFPWPDLPSSRGTVVAIDPWDPSTSGCCTRVPGEDIQNADYCPVLDVQYQTLPTADVEPGNGQAVQVQFEGTLASMALSGVFPNGTKLGVILTDVPPPERIIDFSPVYWVGIESGELPAGALVSLSTSNFGGIVIEGTSGQPSLYYSEDGVEFEELEAFEINLLGPTALIEKPGFVVAGIGPGRIECEAPDEESP